MRNGCATPSHELAALAPEEDEEDRLAAERQRLQQGERRAEAIAAALAELTPRDRRSAGPGRRAARRAPRAAAPAPCRRPDGGNPAGPALAALERAEEALAEAETLLDAAGRARPRPIPRLLEQAEERLFALRAAARKHGVAVAELPRLARHAERAAGGAGDRRGRGRALEQAAARGARGITAPAAAALSDARTGAPPRSWSARLPRNCRRSGWTRRASRPRSRRCDEAAWGPGGADAVRFLIATNPGQEPGPLGRIASGGELSRLMLALKVVLSAAPPVPTLVFDEVDSGIGGATAAAVGERLARVAERVQVLVVTHSPQVAARGAAHLRVAKSPRAAAPRPWSIRSTPRARREEIARMLAGETITEAARAAADDLLGAPRMSRKPRAGPVAAPITHPAEELTEAEAAAELAIARRRDRPARPRLPPAGRAEITDADYDALRRRNAAIEARFPAADPARFAVAAASAARPETGFAKLRHRVPMLSLDNAFDAAEFAEFCARARRFLGLDADATLRLRRRSRRSTGFRST